MLCALCITIVYRFGKWRVFDTKMHKYLRNTDCFGTIIINHIRGLYVWAKNHFHSNYLERVSCTRLRLNIFFTSSKGENCLKFNNARIFVCGCFAYSFRSKCAMCTQNRNVNVKMCVNIHSQFVIWTKFERAKIIS